MSDDQLDDQRLRKEHWHIARHLGISPDLLADQSYLIDEITLNDGTPVALRVHWSGGPPTGVHAQGGPTDWWNDIPLIDPGTSISPVVALSVLASTMTPEMKEDFARSSHAGPLSRMDMLTIGNEMTRFMNSVVGAVMSLEGHNLNSLEKLSQATTAIDDFAQAVLDGAHWRYDFAEGATDE